MRLERLRIESLRQFREPVEIGSLNAGLNLFVGPNGVGKSTIVRAIRAAFFERHASGSVTDLLPWGEAAASPAVEVDFVCQDRRYRLRKRFLGRGRRCTLEVDGAVFENTDAEERLAALLGYQYALKGASRASHWGVPGLLWIEQGDAGQHLHEAVENATDHLRKALDDSVGEIAATGGDEIFDRVCAEREKLLTKTGQPAGELKEVIARLAQARQRVDELCARLTVYREQVDRFGQLGTRIRDDERDRPWQRFEAEAGRARERLEGIARRRDALAADRRLLERTRQQVALLEQQQEAVAAEQAGLERRRAAASAAGATLAGAEESLAPRQAAVAAARAEHERCRALLAEAEQAAERRRLAGRRTQLQSRHGEIEAAIAQARELAARLHELRAMIAAQPIDDAQLATLRRQEEGLQAARIRLEAAATGLAWRLEPGRSILIDGSPATGESGSRRLVAPTTVSVPGIGELVIEPGGGGDVARLAGMRDAQEAAQHALLRSLGLATVADAEQRLSQRKAAQQEAGIAQARLDLLAPRGLEALLAERATLAGELADLDGRLAALGTAGADPGSTGAAPPTVPVDEARRQLEQAAGRLEVAQAAADAARRERDAASLAAAHAGEELRALEATLRDEVRRQRQVKAREELVAAQRQLADLALQVRAAEDDIEAARPQLLQQDAERFAQSARQAQQAHENRRLEVAAMESQLEAAGAAGLEELLAEAGGDLQRLQRRHRELDRRARALDLLARSLQAKRQALTSRLQAPLRARLDHYLQLLLPGASLRVDEALKPVALETPPGLGGFDELSFGTREQLSMVSRLAYADLLQEAGRPTLIIVDDGLVHSDQARLAQMKRILYDAASRHQILLFSCHPDRWEDLGVPAREVATLSRARFESDLFAQRRSGT